MKRGFYVLIVLCMCISYKVSASGHEDHNTRCGENGFATEVIKSEIADNGCINYTLEVSHNNQCARALSHYTVAVSCGKISNVSNSENWTIEYGYDPTTGLTGFKVDNIPNFGDTDLNSFTVSFTVCQDGNRKCSANEGCCYPVVAYKAATCVYYEKLEAACPVPPADPPSADLKASIQKHDITCYGAADGGLWVTVDQGVEPFTYLWSTGATTKELSALQAGDYEVTVKDANGAELLLSGTLFEPLQLVVSGQVTHESCGNGSGSIDLSVTGGNGTYSFNWNAGLAETEDLSSLHAGTYTVIVSDENGCQTEASFVVENHAQLNITATTTMPACGQTNGSIDITVEGGTEPYTYLWSDGTTTEDLQNIGPGNYSLTVQDASGCSANTMLNVKENNTLKVIYAVTQTSCQDDGSGAIDITVTGGTGPYTYLWTNNETSEDISGLVAGIYSVTVTDAAGCSITSRISVTKKTFQVNSTVTQPVCEGSQGGSISLFPINTTEIYTYLWSTGEMTSSVSGLSPGMYTVTITDGTGCSRDLVYVISDPTGITASSAISNDQCNAEGAYRIDLTVSGGQGPYTYQWSDGATTEDIEGASTETYNVTITDVNGCSTNHEVVVTGTPSSWACLIDLPEAESVCGSSGNELITSVQGADSYSWQVESTDGQWVINEGAQSPLIVYTAGGVNSSAKFTLTIVKDGCTQTCEYEATTCKDGSDPTDPNDNPGDNPGDDSGGDNPDGDESCSECFNSEIVTVEVDGSCRTYEVKISTDGACRHDLSHWTIAIPCGSVENYSNSENWKMEYGKDPTTGIYGLKVDDISYFGKSNDYFTVRFTVCTDSYDCKDKLEDWSPTVAYKAGQCVAYETLDLKDEYSDDPEAPVCKAYPNPFVDKLTFEWTAKRDDDVCLDILDAQGNHVKSLYSGKVYRGEKYKVDCSSLTSSFYIYRFCSRKKTTYGKICKTR
jgi:SprB repeat/Secretion system C-terminal sorting domain